MCHKVLIPGVITSFHDTETQYPGPGQRSGQNEEGQVQEADLHGGPSMQGMRGLGTRPRAVGSEGSVWGISTMSWALLLITILTQGSGEASREGTPGISD